MNTAFSAQQLATKDEADGLSLHFLTFSIGEDVFAFPLESVLEIIRVPQLVRVPLMPPFFIGLGNLRGTLLPVLDLRGLLELPRRPPDDAARVVVTDCGVPVGLLVDEVSRVLDVDGEKLKSPDETDNAERSAFLRGVLKNVGGCDLIQVLDPGRLVAERFEHVEMAELGKAEVETSLSGTLSRTEEGPEDEEELARLVSFQVGGQEYAFEISDVEEIVRVPREIAQLPNTEDYILGLVNLRGRLLPLVGLREFFSLGKTRFGDQTRIVVVGSSGQGEGRGAVGVVVDQAREVLQVSPQFVDSIPPLLSQDEGMEEVKAVCRLDSGARLVFVLDGESIVGDPAVSAVMEAEEAAAGDKSADTGKEVGTMEVQDREDMQVVVFQLADEEFGVPVEAVNEITRVPEKISRVPEAPEFVEGLMNLRGTVLPVMDMRTRFGLERLEKNDRQRVIVLTVKGAKTGFVVDAVVEVLRLSPSVVEKAPYLSSSRMKAMGKVANLKESGRMILILDPEELLEEGLVDELMNTA